MTRRVAYSIDQGVALVALTLVAAVDKLVRRTDRRALETGVVVSCSGGAPGSAT